MKTLPRRTFIRKTASACMGGCLFLNGLNLDAMGLSWQEDQKPDPESLNYCGYTCPGDCKFKKASIENDAKLKKEAFDAWQIKEQYGLEFDASSSFCFGCKTDQPEGVVTANCTVRKCAREKEFESCIQCNELSVCKKDLWSRFPDFYKQVIGLQQKYMES